MDDLDRLELIDDVRQALALSTAAGIELCGYVNSLSHPYHVGIVGGLMGGIHGSMTTVRLGIPVARPASLFAFYTVSCMTFRAASKHIRHRHDHANVDSGYTWKDTMVGVGWSTMIFGRALTGRPWILVLPAAITTAALLTTIEQGLPALRSAFKSGASLAHQPSMPPQPTQTTPQAGMNWIQRRWERIALMEARLHALNHEIAQLSSREMK